MRSTYWYLRSSVRARERPEPDRSMEENRSRAVSAAIVSLPAFRTSLHYDLQNDSPHFPTDSVDEVDIRG